MSEFSKLLLIIKNNCNDNNTCISICNQYHQYAINTLNDIKSTCDYVNNFLIFTCLIFLFPMVIYLLYTICSSRRRGYILIGDEFIDKEKCTDSRYFDIILGCGIFVVLMFTTKYLFWLIYSC